MNRSTFKDAVTSRVSALANDVEDDDDDDDKEINTFRGNIEGEEEVCEEEYNEAGDAMEPFNLKNDREIGFFDENMNFVFKKEKSETDGWLASMNEEEMEKSIGEAAAAAQKKREMMLEYENKESIKKMKSVTELKLILLKILQPGETIVKAMRRISGKVVNPIKKRGPPSNKNIKNDNKSDQNIKKLIDELTEISDDLIAQGVTNALSLTYEAIDSSLSQWEYKGLDGQIHGPYSSQQIAEWKSQGYFTGNSAVLMRKVTINHSNHNPKKKIRFETDKEALMNDLDSDNDDENNENTVTNEWILSDDIDFGEVQHSDYLNVDYSNGKEISSTNNNVIDKNNKSINENENDSDNENDNLDTISNKSRKRKEIIEDDDNDD